jgi:hypothetical protein
MKIKRSRCPILLPRLLNKTFKFQYLLIRDSRIHSNPVTVESNDSAGEKTTKTITENIVTTAATGSNSNSSAEIIPVEKSKRPTISQESTISTTQNTEVPTSTSPATEATETLPPQVELIAIPVIDTHVLFSLTAEDNTSQHAKPDGLVQPINTTSPSETYTPFIIQPDRTPDVISFSTTDHREEKSYARPAQYMNFLLI